VSYNKQFVKIGSAVFAQLTLLLNPQNSMLYNAFQSARHPQKCPFECMGHQFSR